MSKGNGILGALDSSERKALEEDLEAVQLEIKSILHEPGGDAISHVYFPDDGVLSLLTVLTNGMAVELGHVGREGMVDIAVFLGLESSESRIVVQVPGTAMRMRAKRFQQHLESLPGLRRVMGGYVLEFFTMVAQTTACNRQHNLQQRLARWVLCTQDRAVREEFPITQEFLAEMLGVTRPKVTGAASRLKARGVIGYRRGVMSITDRPALEDITCECYALIRDRFDEFEDRQRALA